MPGLPRLPGGLCSWGESVDFCPDFLRVSGKWGKKKEREREDTDICEESSGLASLICKMGIRMGFGRHSKWRIHATSATREFNQIHSVVKKEIKTMIRRQSAEKQAELRDNLQLHSIF